MIVGVFRKARVVDGGAREEHSCTPALGVRGNAGAGNARSRGAGARARDVARTFTSAAIVAHLARRAVSSAPRACASPQIHTRSSHVDDRSRVPTVTVSVARFFQSRRVITRARS